MAQANYTNRTIWTGDNLPIMRGMNSESVDLIYLDPPFNSKANYAAPIGSAAAGAEFKDTWTLTDIDEAWLTLLSDKPQQKVLWRVIQTAMSNSDKSYLIYMAVRLLEMKRLLKPTGSVYLHCDSTMSHYLKLLMDAVFGRKNFRNEIVWKRHVSVHGSFQHAPKQWGSLTDVLLFYSKTSKFELTPYREMTTAERSEKFQFLDENTGRRYYDDSAHIWNSQNMGARPNLCFEWRGFRNPHASGWRLSKERLEEEYQKGNIVIQENGKLQRRKYEDEFRGTPLGNLWADISPAPISERTGYPTQKPLALLERIIKASSNEGDMVFDPFCGCATSLVAADRIERQWVGIDISELAVKLVERRIKDDQGLFQDITPRTDNPRRTDLGKLSLYNSLDNRKFLYGEQAGHCNGCKTHFQMQHLTIDHIIALSKGGTDHIENLQLLCAHCNSVKGNRGQEYLISKLGS